MGSGVPSVERDGSSPLGSREHPFLLRPQQTAISPSPCCVRQPAGMAAIATREAVSGQVRDVSPAALRELRCLHIPPSLPAAGCPGGAGGGEGGPQAPGAGAEGAGGHPTAGFLRGYFHGRPVGTWMKNQTRFCSLRVVHQAMSANPSRLLAPRQTIF